MDAETTLNFISKYGLGDAIVIVAIIILTWIIKGPIKKAGLRYAEKYSVDKSAVTWVISLIPYALALIAAFVISLWENKWDISKVDWATVVKQMAVLAGASQGVYETINVTWKGAQARKEKAKNEISQEASTSTSSSTSASVVANTATLNAKAVVVTNKKAEAKKEDNTKSLM